MGVEFDDPFRGSHDVGRAHCLVGRDDDDFGDVMSDGTVDQGARTDNVVHHRRMRVGLAQRNVFEGRRMDHDIGALGREDRIERFAVGDAAQVQSRFGEFFTDLIKVVLAVVDQDKPRRSETAALQCDFAPDASAASGDQYGFVFDEGTDGCGIKVFWVAGKKFFHRKRSDGFGSVGKEGGTFDLFDPRFAEKLIGLPEILIGKLAVDDSGGDFTLPDCFSQMFGADDFEVLNGRADHVAVFRLERDDGNGIVGDGAFQRTFDQVRGIG